LGDEAEWEGGIRAALRKMINAHKDPPFNPSLWKTLADQFVYHIVVYLVKKIICPRRKVTFVIRLSFQGQNQDFDLKCCMEGRNLKNNITGRKDACGPPQISPMRSSSGQHIQIHATRIEEFIG
jgi:hypothetical protein